MALVKVCAGRVTGRSLGCLGCEQRRPCGDAVRGTALRCIGNRVGSCQRSRIALPLREFRVLVWQRFCAARESRLLSVANAAVTP